MRTEVKRREKRRREEKLLLPFLSRGVFRRLTSGKNIYTSPFMIIGYNKQDTDKESTDL